MKRLCFFLGIFLIATSLLAGEWCDEKLQLVDWCEGWELEARGAGVYHQSETIRHLYSQWAPEVQVEVAKNLWDKLYAWGNIGYLWEHGRSSLLHHETHLRLIPLSFGLKYVEPITCNLSIYFGGGAAYSFLHLKDHAHHVNQRISRQGWGGVMKSGFQYALGDQFFLDLFADYLFQHFSFPHKKYYGTKGNGGNLNGIRTGLGMGARF